MQTLCHHPIGNRGFTLIELSVVLVIIGLIVGGVIAGRSMIRQSQVMSAIVDEQKYIKAALSFRDKYKALPGDMPNATSYWGTNPNGCVPVYASTGPLTATCNGNGNGYIDSYSSVAAGTSASLETFTAWQQLSDAGFIQGSYSGTAGPASWVAQAPGINIPAGSLDNSGFEWTYGTPGGGGSGLGYFSGAVNYQQYLWYGGNYGDDLRYSLLTGPEAASIDQKIDDGYPVTGAVLGGNSQTPSAYLGCVNYTTSGILYLNDTLPRCTLLFKVNW